jgi:hypothetical protein
MLPPFRRAMGIAGKNKKCPAVVALQCVRCRTTCGAPVVQNPFDRSDYYRKKAVSFYELAKVAQPSFLGDFCRRVAVRYMFMAEEILNEARARGEIAPKITGGQTAAPPLVPEPSPIGA